MTRAFIKATKCRHQATTRSVSPGSRQGDSKRNEDVQNVPTLLAIFDGRCDVAVLYRAHRPMEEVRGFHKSH
jgi:hypothetical protein